MFSSVRDVFVFTLVPYTKSHMYNEPREDEQDEESLDEGAPKGTTSGTGHAEGSPAARPEPLPLPLPRPLAFGAGTISTSRTLSAIISPRSGLRSIGICCASMTASSGMALKSTTRCLCCLSIPGAQAWLHHCFNSSTACAAAAGVLSEIGTDFLQPVTLFLRWKIQAACQDPWTEAFAFMVKRKRPQTKLVGW